ncbi:MAG: hypothetical protein AAB914_04625 [Patescibacteria group bacterium]
MAASRINKQIKRIVKDEVLYQVVRPQSKNLSRYKIKRQVAIAEQILQDIDTF